MGGFEAEHLTRISGIVLPAFATPSGVRCQVAGWALPGRSPPAHRIEPTDPVRWWCPVHPRTRPADIPGGQKVLRLKGSLARPEKGEIHNRATIRREPSRHLATREAGGSGAVRIRWSRFRAANLSRLSLSLRRATRLGRVGRTRASRRGASPCKASPLSLRLPDNGRPDTGAGIFAGASEK
jgi:hypothetical protein